MTTTELLKDERHISNTLDLTTRTLNNLNRNGIYTIGELYEYTEPDIINFANMGKTSLDDLRDAIRMAGLPALRIKNRGRCPHCGELL